MNTPNQKSGGELNGLALKRQTAQSSSALKVVGDELHAVEEHAHRPGWGGGRQVPLPGQVGELLRVHTIEVVDIVAAHEEDVPHRGHRPEAHGVVEPEGGDGGGVQDGAVV